MSNTKIFYSVKAYISVGFLRTYRILCQSNFIFHFITSQKYSLKTENFEGGVTEIYNNFFFTVINDSLVNPLFMYTVAFRPSGGLLLLLPCQSHQVL